MVCVENRKRFEMFLEELQKLEKRYDVFLGDAWTTDGVTEMELFYCPEGQGYNQSSVEINSVPYEIIVDYGHYVIFTRREKDE